MKRLTTPAGVFGPYSVIETLGDRYRCDGGDLPFTVVGTGTIDDWTGPALPAPVINPAQSADPDGNARAALVAKLRRAQAKGDQATANRILSTLL